QRHVPWTRLLGDVKTTCESQPIELLEYVRGGRTDFVLKPNDDYGGAGGTPASGTDENRGGAEPQAAWAHPRRRWAVHQRRAATRAILLESQSGHAGLSPALAAERGSDPVSPSRHPSQLPGSHYFEES